MIKENSTCKNNFNIKQSNLISLRNKVNKIMKVRTELLKFIKSQLLNLRDRDWKEKNTSEIYKI